MDTSRGQTRPALGKENDRNGGGFASAYRKAAPVLDGVYQLVAAVLLGTLGGWWLDGKLGTSPWLVIVGAVLGIATGMTVFLRAALRMSRRQEPPKT
ncbi:MAG: AtpZ/AtpI family protein [Deltaproteobacteria bacterium]|nr:AtpZ/AtpI family protein [Deltaproteobacteria bacterium]